MSSEFSTKDPFDVGRCDGFTSNDRPEPPEEGYDNVSKEDEGQWLDVFDVPSSPPPKIPPKKIPPPKRRRRRRA